MQKKSMKNMPYMYKKFKTGCGNKTFIQGFTSKSYDTSRTSCCPYEMKLLSLETIEKFECVVELYKNELAGFRPTPGMVWTSGSDLESQGTYTWCDINKEFSKTLKWSSRQKKNKKEKCVAANFLATANSSLGLITENCMSSLVFICESLDKESRQEVTSKPLTSKCRCLTISKNDNITETTMTKEKVESAAGAYFTKKEFKNVTACGQSYLVQTEKLSYVSSLLYCHGSKKQLPSFNKVEHFTCLGETLLNSPKSGLRNVTQVWISALMCENNVSKVKWCDAQNITTAASNVSWEPGFPKLSDQVTCLAVNLRTGKFRNANCATLQSIICV